MKPALLTPAMLEVHRVVAVRGPITSLDLVAAGWCRTSASVYLRALWRAGVLIRGYSGLYTRQCPKPAYAYVVSARPVRAEVAQPVEPLRLRAVQMLRSRGPSTSREMADELGVTAKAIATLARKHDWPATLEPVAGGTPRYRWSAP